MTWKTGTIRLEAAIAIFHGITFQEIKIEDETVGYRATYPEGGTMSDKSLTILCARLWHRANQND